jgi:hypothetical protein
VREANGRLERIPALMDERIALRPDVIVDPWCYLIEALFLNARMHNASISTERHFCLRSRRTS